jgi:hypothetical protein
VAIIAWELRRSISMHVPKVLVGTMVLLSVTAFSVPASTASEIHDEILRVYSFQPHLLTEDQIAQKSAELDKFWTKAQANQGIYVPGLRQELADEKNPPFFLYDGGMLLLKMSDTPQDRKIVLNAIAHCDLRDVQPQDYFYQVHRLATLGEDTTAAAFRILEDPKFQVIVPQHVLTLGQNYSLIYMLLPTDPQFWTQPAIQRLSAEKEAEAQNSLLLLLWYAQDDAADQAIHAFSQDARQSAEMRQSAQELESRSQHIGAAIRVKAAVTNEAGLRKKRRQVMSRVSDEALLELDDLTGELMAARRH